MAQSRPADSGAAQQDAVDPEAMLDKARRHLADGKVDAALAMAEAVLNAPNKDARSTARALAIRGEVHLSKGRPAEAIADLESALWVKGGLLGRERETASAARTRAMQQSGLGGRQRQPASAPSVERSASPVPEKWPTTARQDKQPAGSGWRPQLQQAPAVATASTEPSPVRAPFTTDTRPAGTQARVSEAAPQPSGLGGFGNFFKNLFGSSDAEDTPPEMTAAVTAPRPEAPATAAVSSFEPQRGEHPALRASSTPPKPTEQARAASVIVAAPAPPSVETGKYRLQLAAVRSKAEALAMADRIRKEEASRLGTRNFEIAEDVYGNMGRFYRVRIGMFAEVTEAMEICASLRRQKRLDCMVLDR